MEEGDGARSGPDAPQPPQPRMGRSTTKLSIWKSLRLPRAARMNATLREPSALPASSGLIWTSFESFQLLWSRLWTRSKRGTVRGPPAFGQRLTCSWQDDGEYEQHSGSPFRGSPGEPLRLPRSPTRTHCAQSRGAPYLRRGQVKAPPKPQLRASGLPRPSRSEPDPGLGRAGLLPLRTAATISVSPTAFTAHPEHRFQRLPFQDVLDQPSHVTSFPDSGDARRLQESHDQDDEHDDYQQANQPIARSRDSDR